MTFTPAIFFLTLTLAFEFPQNELYGQQLKRSGRMEAAALCKATHKIIDPQLFVKHMICRNQMFLNYLKVKACRSDNESKKRSAYGPADDNCFACNTENVRIHVPKDKPLTQTTCAPVQNHYMDSHMRNALCLELTQKNNWGQCPEIDEFENSQFCPARLFYHADQQHYRSYHCCRRVLRMSSKIDCLKISSQIYNYKISIKTSFGLKTVRMPLNQSDKCCPTVNY